MKISSGEEYLKAVAEKNIIDYKNPSCNNCIDCCGALSVVSNEEFKKINKQLKSPRWKSQLEGAKNRYRKRAAIKEYTDLRCPFQNNNRCTIYEIRPKVCREFHCSPELNTWDLDKFLKEHEDHKTILDFIVK